MTVRWAGKGSTMLVSNKPSILIVDDVEANLVALEGVLGDVACNIVRARGGNDALRELLKQEFAVMLLDVQMPEMDGYEVAKYARGDPTTCDVPIIFLTAMHDSEASILRGYGSGAVDFLLKPLNPHVLRAKVRVFLELYNSRRKLAAEVAAHRVTLASLELANTALRHFAQAASHDLKAPLRAMRGLLDALALELGEGLAPHARDYLERSRLASQRMDSLLNALRTYAGLQRPVSNVLVDTNQVVRNVLADLKDRIDTAGASVEVDELPAVHADPDRVYQLLLNLIANAVKFHRPGVPPRVKVYVPAHSRPFTLCVEDNGIGIESRQYDAVFEAFLRLHEESKYEGTGLGLAICKQIVHQHGGSLWVESEPRRGSRFFFTLGHPREPAKSAASTP
jgi:two-component system sensor histidine kinase/response regulator